MAINIGALKIELTADSEKFDKGIRQSLSKVEKVFKDSASKSAKSYTANLAKGLKGSDKEILKIEGRLKKFSSSTKSIYRDLGNQKIKAPKIDGSEFAAKGRGAGQAFSNGLKSSMPRALGDAAVKAARRSTPKFNSVGKEAGAAFSRGFVDRASSGLNTIAAKANMTQQKLHNVGSNLRGRGRSGLVSFTLPLVAGLGLAVRKGSEFERAMVDVVKNVNGLDGNIEAIEDYKQQLLDVGENSELGAVGVAALASSAGKLGDSIEESFNFADVAKDIAIGFDFGTTQEAAQEAGQTVGKIRTLLGATNDEMRLAANSMNFFGDTTASNAKQISQVFLRSAGVLRTNTNLTVDQMSALAASFDAVSPNAFTAATGINNMILNIKKGKRSTDAQITAFNKMGISAEKFANQLTNNTSAAIIGLFKEIRKLDKVSQGQVIDALIGRESIKSVSALIDNLDELEGNLQKAVTKNSAGVLFSQTKTVADEAAKQSDTMSAAWKRFSASIGVAAIGVTNTLEPAIRDLLASVTPLVQKFTEFIKTDHGEQWLKIGLGVTLVASLIPPLLIGLGLMSSGIGVVVSGFGLFSVVASGSLTLVAGKALTLSGVMKSLFLTIRTGAVKAWTAFLAPVLAIGAVVTAVFVAVGAGLLALTGDFKTQGLAMAKGLTPIQMVQTVIKKGWQLMTATVHAVAAGILTLGEYALIAGRHLVDQINSWMSMFGKLGNFIIDTVNIISKQIVNLFQGVVSTIASAVEGTINGMVGLFEEAINKMVDGLNTLNTFNPFWTDLNGVQFGEFNFDYEPITAEDLIDHRFDESFEKAGVSGAEALLRGMREEAAGNASDILGNITDGSEFLDPLANAADEGANSVAGLSEEMRMAQDEMKKLLEKGGDLSKVFAGDSILPAAGGAESPDIFGTNESAKKKKKGRSSKRKGRGRKEQTPSLSQLQSELRESGSLIDQLVGRSQEAFNQIGQSITAAVNGTITWREALKDIGTTILGTVIDSFAQMAAAWITQRIGMAAVEKSLQSSQAASAASTTATALSAASALTAAWAPAALSASIATLGGASVTGTAAYVGALAIGTAANLAAGAINSLGQAAIGSGSNSGGGSNFGGAFMNGGNPPLGKMSLVGEGGVEAFAPRTSGTIISNETLQRVAKMGEGGGGMARGSGEVTVNVRNYGNSEPQITQSGFGDDREIEILIPRLEDALGKRMTRGKGRLAKSIETTYPVQRGKRR